MQPITIDSLVVNKIFSALKNQDLHKDLITTGGCEATRTRTVVSPGTPLFAFLNSRGWMVNGVTLIYRGLPGDDEFFVTQGSRSWTFVHVLHPR